MSKLQLLVLALAGCLVSTSTFGQFAEAVTEYSPGSGFVPGFTNAATTLGEPSTVIPGPFGGPVDPFNPPYLSTQLLSIGASGSLTVKFSRPVLNHPNNRFGIDFIVFGNSGFIITNALDLTTFEWIGIPATDGSLFAHNSGTTRVSVSRDGEIFYQLSPALAPVVDGLLPTDGAGDFHTPADPTLIQADFAGLTLEQMRALYLGSAGGTGFDLSWAVDAAGRPAWLPLVNYVRIEVLTGKSEIDGFASVFVAPGLNR
jgi:hypothetical protein